MREKIAKLLEKSFRRLKRSYLYRYRFRTLFLVVVMGFIIVKMVALSPVVLEEATVSNAPIDPEAAAVDLGIQPVPGSSAKSGDPTEILPDYTIRNFSYVSIHEGQKQWKLFSKRAFLYNKEHIVHGNTVQAFLYDPEGQITVVTGNEAKYSTEKRQLEVFGNVKTAFPDGFKTQSEYLFYKPDTRKVFIPESYLVQGEKEEAEESQRLTFNSNGLDFLMSKGEITLPKNVTMTTYKSKTETSKTTGDDWTKIESDFCLIHREQNLAQFSMYAWRPIKSRFVHITQPSWFVNSRRADLNYGNESASFDYLTAYEDVFIKEEAQKEENARYATAGRADFDNAKNIITLKIFPQVYQNGDTVTGDVVRMHRDTDIVEVDESNAYSDGQSNQPSNQSGGTAR